MSRADEETSPTYPLLSRPLLSTYRPRHDTQEFWDTVERGKTLRHDPSYYTVWFSHGIKSDDLVL